MKKPARQRMIEIADDLFYREGFHAVGLDRIINEVGVTKTTFYNNFESKEHLIQEVLRWHDQWWRDHFARKLREHGGDTARGQLEAVFDVIEELVNTDAYNGCIFINVAVQFPLPHDPVHQLAAEHKEKMEGILRELAVFAGAKDTAALAHQLALLMEGAYVTQQVSRNPAGLQVARQMSHQLIAQHLGAAEATTKAANRANPQ